jgi:hypothetical protein
MATGVMVDVVRVLVEAGATYASAVEAAVALEQGKSIDEAYELLKLAAEPATFDLEQLTARLRRELELVPVGARR